MRTRIGYVIVALALGTLAACSSGTGGAAMPAPAPTSTTTTSSQPATPPLPTKEQLAETVTSLINQAAQRAVGAPEEDRHPKVEVVSGTPCSTPTPKLAVMACPPSTATAPVVIQLNADIVWQLFQIQGGGDDAEALTQNNALGGAIQYLAYRDIQRHHANLLQSLDGTQDAETTQIMYCKTGEIYAGMQSNITASLAQEWQKYMTDKANGSFFMRGMHGEC